jgi:hypothetical protein
MHMQRRHGTRRRAFPPELLDQPVTGERHPAGEQQQRQQGALTAARERHGVSVPLEHERAKYPKTTDVTGHPDTG